MHSLVDQILLQAWELMLVVLATRELEAGRLFEHRSSKPALQNVVRPCL